MRRRRRKHQIPNPKETSSSKLQKRPRVAPASFGYWSLGFLWGLGFWVWGFLSRACVSLEFGIWLLEFRLLDDEAGLWVGNRVRYHAGRCGIGGRSGGIDRAGARLHRARRPHEVGLRPGGSASRCARFSRRGAAPGYG